MVRCSKTVTRPSSSFPNTIADVPSSASNGSKAADASATPSEPSGQSARAYCASLYSHVAGKLSAPAPSTRAPVRSPGGGRRKPAKATVVETLDDTLGPLGPLGQEPAPEADEPPALPQKEQQPTKLPSRPATAEQQSHGAGAEIESARPNSSRPQLGDDASKRVTQPSVAIEQAARPTFNIAVGDPHTVGDLTSSHTVYHVRTKVSTVSEREGRIFNTNALPVADYVQGIPKPRIRSVPQIPRLSLALQSAAQQQSWCRCASATRKAGRWPL